MLQTGHAGLVDAIVTLFNSILRDELEVPEAWRKTKLKVIFKKGDVELPKNYRPISIIPVLAKFIKRFPLTIVDSGRIDEAISTMGGIHFNAVNSDFELKKIKNQFCIGEMLDWNAPTGGYLIQACASIGVYLAIQLNNR